MADIDERRLRDRLDVPVRVYGSTPNTSDWVRRQGHDSAPAGTIAVADELTAARGRSGAWSAPPGGLWTSLLLRPGFDRERVGRLTFAGSLAVADAVRERGVDARIEWPNDVVVPGAGAPRKLAGVLTEAVLDGVPVAGKPVDGALDAEASLDFAVLGVGLNANLDPADVAADRAVTTLRAEVGDVDRTALAADLHERVLARAGQAESDAGFEAALADYREVATTLGARVRVRTRDGGTVVGRAVDVDGRGALVVETDGGTQTVTEGECERSRPV